MLGLSLSHATAQKRLRDDMASVDAALSAERTAHASAIQNRDTIIADLRLQLHGHKKHRFGSKSESCAQLALELILEELEIEQAAEASDEDRPLRMRRQSRPAHHASANLFRRASSGSRRRSPPVTPAPVMKQSSKPRCQAAPFQRVLWGPRCWPTSCAANTGITCRPIARARCLPIKALI